MKNVLIVFIALLFCSAQAVAQKRKDKGKEKDKEQKETTEQKKDETVKEPAKEPAKDTTKLVTPPSPIVEHFARKYAIASRWNDLDVARDAMYDLITEFPNNDSLIFSLAYFYYENQKYPSAILVCQDLLARNPKLPAVLEVIATSYEALNIYDRALQHYESLYLLTSNLASLYKMAFLQYQLKRYAEAQTNADILLAKPEALTVKVVFNDAENKQKEYTMKVALLYLKGLIAKDQGDKINAKKFFGEALAVAPDFFPAKQNLTDLK